ncbi:MAG: enoyl-CoA hydratase/isomerase family protein, partial [Proteobacteria bacterium]|nr:enoyl-CoA hydratase/isomerase family protein [Pseudomonadota bacterium]
CAINGNCLGGGLEFAMSCHYRLAAPGLNLGQPEVQIGLIPGAGGTQRLPRLIGLPGAIEMITVGRPIKSEAALSRGLIDELAPADRLLDQALEAARRFISGEIRLDDRRTRNRFTRLPSAAEKTYVCNGVRFMTFQKAKDHYPAPYKAIDAMDHGLSFDIEADIEREVDYFADCAVTDVCKNLINIFLGTRAAGRLPRIKTLEPAEIKTVAMLGGGVMGSGIVNLLLAGGFETVLWDIDDAALDKGLAAVRQTFEYPIKKKKMKPADLERMIEGRLTLTTDLADCADADLVIEAVLEDMKVKQDIWKKLEGLCRPDAVFATNTSALPITEMAEVLADPGRMIGLHFFNPAHRMQLLEIICAQKTSDQTLATSVAFARTIRKIPIVVNDGPGFYVSRQLGGLMGGSVFLVADGVDGAQIEKAMIDFGMPMGPATLADLTGIDINFHVNRTFERTLGERYRVHPLTEAVYRLGDYGRKTGRGYFDYSDPKKPAPNPRVAEAVQKYRQEHGVEPKKVSDQEIVEAMLAGGINEAAYMIQEGICDRPLDMDLAMIYGTGFPPFRGGILRYADKWGVKNVYDQLLDLEKQYGPRFRPAELLETMAEQNRTFYPS